MEQTLNDLVLASVTYSDPQNVELTFIDPAEQNVWQIRHSMQKYDEASHTFVDDKDAADKAEKWAHENFDLDFANLEDAKGSKHTVYVKDNIKSLSPINSADKFDESMVGKTIQSKIDEVVLDDRGIHIKFSYKGKHYVSNMGFQTYITSMQKYMNDPSKRERQIEKFQATYHADLDSLDSLAGQPIMVSIRSFNKNVFAQVSPIEG